jgi:hypothetical protein
MRGFMKSKLLVKKSGHYLCCIWMANVDNRYCFMILGLGRPMIKAIEISSQIWFGIHRGFSNPAAVVAAYFYL